MRVTYSEEIGRLALGVAGTFLLLSGCATRGGSVPYNVAGFGAPDAAASAVQARAIQILPFDKVQITVFQEPELSGEFRVDHAGRIDFPLLGPLEVQNRTAAEAAELIRVRLAANYLRLPRVQVAITEAAAQTVTVDGAVGQPGVYPIAGMTTLIRAVALARGTTQSSNDARVIVFRTIEGQRMAAAFDLRAIRNGEADDPPIYGNDVIVVASTQAREIFRDILTALPVLGIFARY